MKVYLEEIEYLVDDSFRLKHDIDYWRKQIVFLRSIFNMQLECILANRMYEVLIPVQLKTRDVINHLVWAVDATKRGEVVGEQHTGGIMQGLFSDIAKWIRDNLIKPIQEFVV
jgi:hypothetical protein